MPWKASTTMSQRLEFVELALKESANIRALCREFRITPRTGYKWIKRYQEQGEVGLYDHSRRPKRSPQKSSSIVEEAVLKVRRVHPAWGGRRGPMGPKKNLPPITEAGSELQERTNYLMA